MKHLMWLTVPVFMLASCDDKKKEEGKDKKDEKSTESKSDAPETFRLSICDCVKLGDEIAAKFVNEDADAEEFEKSKVDDLRECEKVKASHGDKLSEEVMKCY
jgi:hypothetical protein